MVYLAFVVVFSLAAAVITVAVIFMADLCRRTSKRFRHLGG
jgi:hypothetical protein